VTTVGAVLRDAFVELPHYTTRPGRGADAAGYDPLSTEGPRRQLWRLTGYDIYAAAGGRWVFICRFSVNDTSRVVFAPVSVTASGTATVHASDDWPGGSLIDAIVRASDALQGVAS
jgi:hypothetical protein